MKINIDKEIIDKYVPENITVVGLGCIMASVDDYKKQVENNNKWYIRFYRFIRNLFN